MYLIRILIYLNKKNCDLIIDNDGMQKIILINKEPSYPMKLRKAAGQVSLHIGEFYPSPIWPSPVNWFQSHDQILIEIYNKNISGLNGGLGVDKNAF